MKKIYLFILNNFNILSWIALLGFAFVLLILTFFIGPNEQQSFERQLFNIQFIMFLFFFAGSLLLPISKSVKTYKLNISIFTIGVILTFYKIISAAYLNYTIHKSASGYSLLATMSITLGAIYIYKIRSLKN
jgi:hypothetical protein